MRDTLNLLVYRNILGNPSNKFDNSYINFKNSLLNVIEIYLTEDDNENIPLVTTPYHLSVRSTLLNMVNFAPFADTYLMGKRFFILMLNIVELRPFGMEMYSLMELDFLYLNLPINDGKNFLNNDQTREAYEAMTIVELLNHDTPESIILSAKAILEEIFDLWNCIRVGLIKFMYYNNIYILDFFKYDYWFHQTIDALIHHDPVPK